MTNGTLPRCLNQLDLRIARIGLISRGYCVLRPIIAVYS